VPNQNNFRSDITTETNPTFFASRIVNSLEENILLEEIPASFGYSATDVIEIHFYTLYTNKLMLSTTISVNDINILKNHIVRYNDGSYKTYIRIDFTELFQLKQLVVIPGEYKVVLNFFSDEVASYNNRNLFIQEISPSRQEVQLAFADNVDDIAVSKNQFQLDEFIPKYFTKAIAIGVTEKIFKSGVELDDVNEGINYESVVNNIEVGTQTKQNTIDRIDRLGITIEQNTKNKINQFIQNLFQIIQERIVINEDEKIQENEFKLLIEQVVTEQLPLLQPMLDDKIIVI